MSDATIPPYRRRTVEIQGKTTIGRPVAWNGKPVTRDMKGVDGEYLQITSYEAQCPFCCLRMSFAGDLKSVQCPHCKKGQNIPDYTPFPDPFCDPGEFDPPDDLEIEERTAPPVAMGDLDP